MNNEIKNILDYLKNNSYTYDEVYIENYCKIITREENEKLLDYITNLQQINKNLTNSLNKKVEEGIKLQLENEKLKQPQIFIDTMDMEERYGQELYEDYLKEQLKDYKSRNEKAIEILELHKKIFDFY